MAKNDNLKDFLTDVANAIRTKKGTTALINPQDFASEIASISTGGGVPSYPNGIYIQHIDGRLFKTEEWTIIGYPNDEANGVAVITDKIQVVVAKSSLGGCMWSSNPFTEVTGLPFAPTAEDALADYSGKENTVLILANDTGGAAYLCSNYQYPNGAKGYLASLGEWEEVYQYKSEVDAAMTIIGAATLGASGFWASTQETGTRAWSKLWTNGSNSNTGKDNTRNARPFTSL